MTDWLVRFFIKDTSDRTAFGKLAGFVGIVCNVILFAGKLLAGIITGSIAILADAANNLSDASANVVSLIGFRLAAKPPDRKHPYGYARYEYVSGFAIAILMLIMGLTFAKESIVKMIKTNPSIIWNSFYKRLNEFIKLGYMIGVGGVVTYKNSRVLKEVVKEAKKEAK